MKKILVVFTGGTIGSTLNGGIINTADNNDYKLIALFRKHFDKKEAIEFKCLQPIKLLSENLFPSVWQNIAETVAAVNTDSYSGIIITHGTDTLAYSASAMSYCLHGVNIPILMVSSNYPLADSRANGLANFNCAIEYIVQEAQRGLYVPYQNQQQTMHLHLGSRLSSSLQLSGDFVSVQSKSYMRFINNKFEPLNPPLLSERKAFHDLQPVFSENIIMLRPYPGLNYSRINLEGVDAVCHDLYHSGTACSSMQWGKDYSLQAFLKHCVDQDIEVYLAPSLKTESSYQSTRELLDVGAEMIWNMSLEAAYVKLLLAYGNFDNKATIMDFINSDIAGEHV